MMANPAIVGGKSCVRAGVLAVAVGQVGYKMGVRVPSSHEPRSRFDETKDLLQIAY
jgi:hypothetical protein